MPREPFELSTIPWTEEQRLFICGKPPQSKPERERFVPSKDKWTPEEEARIRGVLVRSSDRVLGRQRLQDSSRAAAASNDLLYDPVHQERVQEFLGSHYENGLAEVTFRREIMDTAKAMDEGRLPVTPEAVDALVHRQQDWLQAHPSYLIPSKDLNVDALRD